LSRRRAAQAAVADDALNCFFRLPACRLIDEIDGDRSSRNSLDLRTAVIRLCLPQSRRRPSATSRNCHFSAGKLPTWHFMIIPN
jgi:hypothetical protein